MSLNHFRGPASSAVYMGFSTKPHVRGPGAVRRTAKGTSMLMATGVAISALVGVVLGLRDAGDVTYAESLRTEARPASSLPVEPRLADARLEAIPWRPASLETTSASASVTPPAASPTPDVETSADPRRKGHVATGFSLRMAEVEKERRAEAPQPVRAMRKASKGSRDHIRPPGWPYVSSAADPPY
jgi:hypothetical protein